MLIQSLQTLFKRDLEKLKTEISSYQDKNKIWQIEKSVSNSAGNLCLHLIGNLNAYIGVGLAKTNYVRNRDLEFSDKGIAVEELIRRLDATIAVVEAGLNNLEESSLEVDFPIMVWEKPSGMVPTLLHLSTHLSYHLGQVNYHRRLLDT